MEAEEKLLKNWTNGSANYSSIIQEELSGPEASAWHDLISENIPDRKPLKVLDVGTGPGFFAIILTQAGHEVTAIDCTQAMLAEAKKNAAGRNLEINFQEADSHDLPFETGSFDLAISRNVAWTLIDAQKAYGEWHRVLNDNGRTLIFDANWNHHLFNEDYRMAHERDLAEFRQLYPYKEPHPMTTEMIDYRKSMPQCARVRPAWDIGALIKAGFDTVYVDTNVGPRVYDQATLLIYRTYPMFMLVAAKRPN
ncbi:MAG: class I SAM-dependent methyltransferase [Deltaproteobacteria bacterium]|jgi:ubiquinone/menaquinone biosynthesis C-methylase UbiE|nr:class I SAM-dependent methyltransferase [Deltaproteobacteria bacterium]